MSCYVDKTVRLFRERNKRHIKEQKFFQQPTPFIGRSAEVSEVACLLKDPACCLLTLIGLGGVGKTRLAIEAARQLQPHFAHGVHFISLQPVSSASFLLTAIADVLDVTLIGPADPETQIKNYLQNKKILLLLDNFEQLLPQGGAEQLTRILSHAPKLKLLVTSREVLSLQEEWLYPVRGLSFPLKEPIEHLETYDAVHLFVERAKRVRRDFSLVEEQAGVIRICHLVEGMPLALEIAASWTKTLRCEVIAAEISHNLSVLTTDLRNMPERHRRMQTLFDQSWKLLTTAEQDVFKRLSVFKGGFQWAAARHVAGTTLPLLSALVSKSLLQEAHGRYQIHELLRQYAAKQLQKAPPEVVLIYHRHCAYWANFLQERDSALNGQNQRAAIADIETELENIRAAWQWAVEKIQWTELAQSADALYLFYQFRSRYREGAEAFDAAVQCLERAEVSEQTSQVLAEILVHAGWLCIRLGQLERAQAFLKESVERYACLENPPPPRGMATDPLIPLGVLATIHGDYGEAVRLGEVARQQALACADKGNLMFSSYVLTSAFLAQGRYQTAYEAAQQAYSLASELGNRWFMAYCLNDMGNVALALKDYPAAKQHYQASYDLKHEFNDPEGMAVGLSCLGHVALLQRHFSDAQKLFQQSLAIYQDIGDQGGLAACLEGLGITARLLDDDEAAKAYFQRALRITFDRQLIPLTLSILASIGEWWVGSGRPQRGVELLSLVQHHPSSDQVTKDRVQKCLPAGQAPLLADQISAALQYGAEAAADLETVIAALQVELMLFTRDDASSEGRSGTLPENLTSRELEVLCLIADGLPNQEIASELVIAVGTVKAHASSIYNKLGVKNRAEAVRRAIELNLL